jgi:MscS family membrane protein
MASIIRCKKYGSTKVFVFTFFMVLTQVNIILPTCPLAQVGIHVAKESSQESSILVKEEEKKAPPVGPIDELDRGVPRTSVEGFLNTTRVGDFERAAQYLDLRNLPRGMHKKKGPDLARQLKTVIERALLIDFDELSNSPEGLENDGLASYRDSIGRIKTPEKTVEILLQKVPRKDGVFIWKFSNQTVAKIPHLYKYHGYRPFEETLSKMFPDVVFLGWFAWQWAVWAVLLILSTIIVLLPTWMIALLLRRKDTEMHHQLARFVSGPVRLTLWLVTIRYAVHIINPSLTLRTLLNIAPVLWFAVTWLTIRSADLIIVWFEVRMKRNGQESATVLLRPARKAFRITIIVLAILLWLDNIGFKVSTLLAGLGVGGLAVALAAQDTLKNLLGSIMIILDKPYIVGQRILAKGHDGIVEEIGLRSTKMRLLNGHQATIPNEELARIDIENIGRRPHIRRLSNIRIAYDTPSEKAEKAVFIIKEILENHEGMHPDFLPRVYFNDLNSDSLNIMMIYWYHPPDYWAYMEYNEQVNLKIIKAFEKEGIKFAFPTTTTYLTQEDGEPLYLDIAGHSETL